MAFLDEACAGDEELRREVESLLEVQRQGGQAFWENQLWKQSPEDLGRNEPASLIGTTAWALPDSRLFSARAGWELSTRRATSIWTASLPSRCFLPNSWQIRIARGDLSRKPKRPRHLNHPNIITIHDIASDNGTDFIVMEYVQGKTLGQLIPRRGLKLNEVLKYAIQIADALAKAQAAGIIHRDLKPGNIMVGEGGLVKVLDFGLAKLTERPQVGEDESTRYNAALDG